MAEQKKGPPVHARPAHGFRDLMPEQMFARNEIIDTIRRICELYGFLPLHTPGVERLDVLQGSAGEARHSILRVLVREAIPEEFGLRFDLTVPLARVIATNEGRILLPFRRYQVGPVWRAGDSKHPHEREFTMFDFDSIGVHSALGDTEVIAATCDILRALGARAIVRYSTRAIFRSLLDLIGLGPSHEYRLIETLNKRDEIGPDIFRASLTSGYKSATGAQVAGLGLKRPGVRKVEAFLGIRSRHRGDVIRQLHELFAPLASASSGINVLDRVSQQLTSLGYGDDVVAIDPSVARTHTYYTGIVFEAILRQAPKLGPVSFGGRYDKLIERYFDHSIAATGASIHVDRLLEAREHLRNVRTQKASAQVFVAHHDDVLLPEVLAVTRDLRNAGIATQLYTGNDPALDTQLRYAEEAGIATALVCADGLVSIRRAGDQASVARHDLVATLRKMLDEEV